VRSLLLLLLIFSAGVAEARDVRDRTRDHEGLCGPGVLPPGAGISGCPQPLNAENQPWRPRDPVDQRPPPELKPLWVPPLAPSSPRRP
jgi:hypothetical protein